MVTAQTLSRLTIARFSFRYKERFRGSQEGILPKGITYKSAGVDIEAGNRFVRLIRPMVRRTYRPEVLADIGGFGALFSFPAKKYRDPVLVSSTDGVGTKLRVAFLAGKHDTVGIDLVAMSVNDIVVQGAEPLFFLDYFGTGKLSLSVSAQVIRGIARGCREAGCALIGGETAEMPSFYREGEYDLAGFAVGVAERAKIITGAAVRSGDQLIGLASSGLHSNGYSLARKILFERLSLQVRSRIRGLKRPLGAELLIPTRIYVKTVLNLLRDFPVHGIAHITGGGFTDNIPRILPKGLRAVIRRGTWPVPPIFRILQEGGRVSEAEMFRTFNNGIGLVLVVPPSRAEPICRRLKTLGEKAFRIGFVEEAGRRGGAIAFR
jgi:phosphoribosylformylglycinamidine cyclo-ligase